MVGDGTGTAAVRLGVSGHRASASDPAAVAALVDEVLDDLGPRGEVVSSLAEGADRLVAERIAGRAGWSLEVVLPLDPADYEADFGDPGSRAAFRALLASAARLERVPRAASREAAYLAAGRAVLDRSDALLTIWDGEPARGPGGTGEIVAEARRRELPIAWILVHRSRTDDGGDGADTADGGAPVPPTLTLERWPWTR